MNIVVIIGVAVALLNFIWRVLEWCKIGPAEVRQYLIRLRQALPWNTYLLFAFAFSLLIGFVLVTMTMLPVFQIEIVIIDIMMLWALLAVWIPAIQRLQNIRVNKAVDVANICFAVLIVVGFWISQWPAWHKPALVTSLLMVIPIIYVFDRFIVKRKIHAKDSD